MFRNPASKIYAQNISGVLTMLSAWLEVVQESTANYYHKKQQSIENFNNGEFLLLNGKEIQSKGRC
jgi:hypothetical protein